MTDDSIKPDSPEARLLKHVIMVDDPKYREKVAQAWNGMPPNERREILDLYFSDEHDPVLLSKWSHMSFNELPEAEKEDEIREFLIANSIDSDVPEDQLPKWI